MIKIYDEFGLVRIFWSIDLAKNWLRLRPELYMEKEKVVKFDVYTMEDCLF